jgi:hypothetical protein
MKKFAFYLVVLLSATVFVGCSKDDDDKSNDINKEEPKILLDKCYKGVRNIINDYQTDYITNDTKIVNFAEALSFVPTTLYTEKTDWEDVNLLWYEETCDDISLQFNKNGKAIWTVSTTTKESRRNATKEAFTCVFNGDYYTENSMYMVNVKNNIFSYYNKVYNIRSDFRLDGNYTFNETCYINLSIENTTTAQKKETKEYDYTIRDGNDYFVIMADEDDYIQCTVTEWSEKTPVTINIRPSMMSFNLIKLYLN